MAVYCRFCGAVSILASTQICGRCEKYYDGRKVKNSKLFVESISGTGKYKGYYASADFTLNYSDYKSIFLWSQF